MSKQKGFSIVEALLIIVLVCTISFAGYFVYSRQVSGEKTYLQAYENGFSFKPDQQVYTSFDIRSEVSRLQGEAQGSLKENNQKHTATYAGTSTHEGVPFTMTFDVIGISASGKSESYTRLRDVRSEDLRLNEILQQLHEATLNKWEFNEEDIDNNHEQSTFKDNGIFAAWDVSGLFAPAVSFSPHDREVVMKALELHRPYSVDSKVQHVRFKGQPARKLVVKLNNSAYKKFDEAVSKDISKEAEWQLTKSKLLKEFYTGKSDFSASVYLDKTENRFIGVETDIRLAAPIKDSMTNEDFQSVQATFFIDYNRDLHIDVPHVDLKGKKL